jgi:hypothetical protein
MVTKVTSVAAYSTDARQRPPAQEVVGFQEDRCHIALRFDDVVISLGHPRSELCVKIIYLSQAKLQLLEQGVELYQQVALRDHLALNEVNATDLVTGFGRDIPRAGRNNSSFNRRSDCLRGSRGTDQHQRGHERKAQSHGALQRILVNDTVFHHKIDVFGIDENGDIIKRIAVNQENISKASFSMTLIRPSG